MHNQALQELNLQASVSTTLPIKNEELRNVVSSQREKEILIESLLPLVKQVVNRMSQFLPSQFTREELMSAGTLGLLDAVKRYDHRKGSSLNTYCSLRIRGAVLDELRRLNWLPRSVHRDARKLAQIQDQLAQALGREATTHEIQRELKMGDKKFLAFLNKVKPVTFFSLQEPAFNVDGSNSVLNEEILPDDDAKSASEEMLQQEDRQLLVTCLNKLSKSQTQVLVLYYIEDLRLKEIADILHLTESRVSQIHTLAMNRLRTIFQRERAR